MIVAGIKTEYWVTIYESHDSDLVIFVERITKITKSDS